jgi:hypothetical protein
MTLRIQCLCLDTTEPSRLAGFWQEALGWRRTHQDEDQIVLEPPEGSQEYDVVPDLLFLRVPEGKAVKNRLDLDLRPLGRRGPRGYGGDAVPRCFVDEVVGEVQLQLRCTAVRVDRTPSCLYPSDMVFREPEVGFEPTT